MALKTLPSQFAVRSFVLTLQTNQRVSASPEGGSEQVIDRLNDRWVISAELIENSYLNSAYIEAFIAAMRGQVNTVNLWHFARPVPTGTMRGSLTLSADAAQGAGSLVVTGGAGQAGTTLKAGDMLSVGNLLVMCESDCTANGSGVITVPITNRIRTAQLAGAVVTWNQASAPFRILSNSGVQYLGSNVASCGIEFGEAIA